MGFAPTFYFGLKTMNKELIQEKIYDISARVAEENNLELVHTEVVGSNKNISVRVFIDKPEGVTHQDCSAVSRQIDAILESDDFIPSAYLLEVSSPGLERDLYSLKDFEKFSGNLAKVKLHKPVEGQRNFKGRIIAVEGDEIVFEDKTSGKIRFPYGSVSKANLEIDLDQELKRG